MHHVFPGNTYKIETGERFIVTGIGVNMGAGESPDVSIYIAWIDRPESSDKWIDLEKMARLFKAGRITHVKNALRPSVILTAPDGTATVYGKQTDGRGPIVL